MVAAFALAAPVIIGALPEILLAIAALLLVFWLGVMLEKPLVSALQGIPVLGGNIANAVSQGLARFHAWLSGWVDGVVGPAIGYVMGFVHNLVAFPAVTVGAIEYLMDQLRLVTNAAGGHFALVARQVASLSGSLSGLANRIVSVAAAAASALGLAQLLRSTVIPQAQAAAEAHAGAYTRSQVSAEAQARAEAIAQARLAAAALVSLEAKARESGDAKVAAAAAAAAAAIRAALGELSTHVRTETDAKVTQLEGELTRLREQTIPKVQAQEATDVATLTAELTIAQQALRCLEPLCSSGYANLIGQLLEGAELLALLELVGQAVRDPQGTAREMAGLVGGIEGAVSGMLSPFIGRA